MSNLVEPSQPTRIALFGGAFDPFHNGHVAAIKHILRSGLVDKVLVLPSGDRPDKSVVSSARSRYDMALLGVRECFGDDARVVVSDLHSSGRVGYGTIDLLRYFEKEGGSRVFVVIGDELLNDLPRWKEADDLKKRATFLVMRRPGVVTSNPLPGWNVKFLDPFENEGVLISSTELRKRLARGESCEGLMPTSVAVYCREKGLYSGL